ncbi:MAG: Mrp/NBP35 family ATP-binding protein [Methanotrichaceae archaeon]|nr:Mrp/NBP35 family ATP-binding protein [Methanotrichaceae archaeon]
MTERDDKCETCTKKTSCKEKDKGEACIFERMGKIRHKLIIASGKGGVGKSTVTVNLARALILKGYRVGILDADITGPNIPKLLGIEGARLRKGAGGIEPADANGIKVVSMALILSSSDSAVVWRGPMKMAAIKQFLQEVNWGDLDFLLVDLPPGTSDEPLSVVQLIPDLTGAVIVTTPQEVSLLDSRKAVNMVKNMKVSVLGVVENMGSFYCPHCGKAIAIFSTGGGARMAEEMGVPFLGSIPMDPDISSMGDAGITFADSSSPAGRCFQEIVERLLQSIQ